MKFVYKDVEKLVEDIMVKEVSLSKKEKAERQEYGFVLAIKNAIMENDGEPIHVQFENGYYMPNVVGARKITRRPADGYENYTDVEIETKKHGTYHISMKGKDSPSIAPGGDRIESIYPRFLLAATKAATKALKDAGYRDGDWWIENKKSMKSTVRKIIKKTFDPKSDFFEKEIVFVITDGDKEDHYHIKNFNNIKDIPSQDDAVEKFGSLPPFLGGRNMKQEVEGNTVKIYVSREIDVNPTVPDVYIPLSQECIETLIRGNEKMGGPIDYVYIGDMEVRPKPLKKRKGRTSVLSVNAVLRDPDADFKGKKGWLRVRKRRADMPFDSQKIIYDKDEKEYRYVVFDKGIYSGESSRIVIATKLPKGSFVLDDEIDCCQIDGGCSGDVDSPNLMKTNSVKENLTPNKKEYIMIENLVKEIMGVE